MKLMNKSLSVLVVAGLFLAGCGKNPFGPGAAGGLNLFAKIGKALAKPSAINEEENGKEGAKNTITPNGAKEFLGKGLQAKEIWLVDNGITENGDGTCSYWEQVRNKPDDRDPWKLFTGRAEVNFKYGGATPVTLANINLTLVQDVYSFKANGREVKTWHKFGDEMETDTIDIMVTFSQGSIQAPETIKPGYTTAWGKNISAADELGRGDTASFSLTRLDDSAHIQYGSGTFFDAKDDNGESHSFSFDLEIIHKNSQNPDLPYLRYEDNEGVLTFTLPWGKTGDNLFFHIHFYPPVGSVLGYREINIYKNDINGDRLYYLKSDDHGVELEKEDFTD